MRKKRIICQAVFISSLFALPFFTLSQGVEREEALDRKVQIFLAKTEYRWHDMNVPERDGELLYQIVIDHQYKRALEIGTSTGRSAIYIAWALSKTGGKLITIEIDEERHHEALANIREAGLSDYTDARLADAHQLVEELQGPFDFIFIDADKGWYTNYAKALIPKLQPGGCIAAHNVYEERSGWRRYDGGTEGYFEYMKSLPEFESRILSESRGGLSVSYKKN